MKRFLGLLICLFVVLSLAVPQHIQGQISAAPQNWVNAVLETKKLVMERAKTNQIPLDSLNVDSELRELQQKFPKEMSALMPYMRSNPKRFLSGMDGSPERNSLQQLLRILKVQPGLRPGSGH
jgi:hypothetical protein